MRQEQWALDKRGSDQSNTAAQKKLNMLTQLGWAKKGDGDFRHLLRKSMGSRRVSELFSQTFFPETDFSKHSLACLERKLSLSLSLSLRPSGSPPLTFGKMLWTRGKVGRPLAAHLLICGAMLAHHRSGCSKGHRKVKCSVKVPSQQGQASFFAGSVRSVTPY